MADINTISEDLSINILSRLPVKPLLCSKCVSKYWCGLIADANFMKWRSRHMILLPVSPLCSLDDNVPANDTANSIIKVSDRWISRGRNYVAILGTIDGVVLLVVERCSKADMILYNPFTRDHKLVPHPDPPFIFPQNTFSACGFGYGSSPKDLKVVVFRSYHNCHVFSFEGGSWSAPQISPRNFIFQQNVGIFLNGFLHWLASRGGMFIAALDMTKMVFTEMRVSAPCTRFDIVDSVLDRTREGWLCMLSLGESCKVDMWVMKKYGLEESWSKLFSIKNVGDPIGVLGNRKIAMVDHLSREINNYDPEKETYKKVKVKRNIAKRWGSHGCMEYVESLVSSFALFPNF